MERRVRKEAAVLLSALVLCGWNALWMLQANVPLLSNRQSVSEACWFSRLLLSPEAHQRGTQCPLSALLKLHDTVLLPHQRQKPSR